MSWTPPITWSTGLALNSTNLNTIRDSLKAIGDARGTFTPSWTASTTNPTLGTSVLAGRVRITGQTADIHIDITVGSGFAAGSGGYIFGLPAGLNPFSSLASDALGFGIGRDVSAPTSRPFAAYFLSSTTFALIDSSGAIAGAASPWVWAAGDILSLHLPSLEIA